MLNSDNTKGLISRFLMGKNYPFLDVRKQLLGQWIAGLYFGLTGGQLFLIMLSTAPFSIYIEGIGNIMDSNKRQPLEKFLSFKLWCNFTRAQINRICPKKFFKTFSKNSNFCGFLKLEI